MKLFQSIRKVHGLWIMVVAICMTMMELMYVRVTEKYVLGVPEWMHFFMKH